MLRPRTFLVGLVISAVAATASVVPNAAAEAAPPLRVYVVVLDGLAPHEVDPTLTPNLSALRDEGTWYEAARAVLPAETLPNHAAMMTGVLPERSGIVANDYWMSWFSGQPEKSRMANPNLLGVDTTTTRLENACDISTATPQSKGYLWGLFRGEPAGGAPPANYFNFPEQENPDHPTQQRQADYHPRPTDHAGYIIDPDDHTIDQTMMNQAVLPWLRSNPPTPHFAFVSLGDIDRSGHVDQSGAHTDGGLTAFRQLAITDTDSLVGRMVDELKASGAWDETVLIIASDHRMDWSTQDKDVSRPLAEALTAADYGTDSGGQPGTREPDMVGEYWSVAGGGTNALYVEENEDIPHVAEIAAGVPGVALVATRTMPADPTPEIADKLVPMENMDMMHDRYNGEVVVFADQGFAFRAGNPLPGNHGHAPTQPSTLMVAGGHPVVDDEPQSVPGSPVYDPPATQFSDPDGGPGNLSIATTVAALFGLGEIDGGYDGEPLHDAFEDYAFASHTPCTAASPDDVVKQAVMTLQVVGKGSNSRLEAMLIDADSSTAIAGAVIDFSATGTSIGQATTDGDGIATLEIPPRYRGANQTYEATFGGNEFYGPTSASASP
ncbi:MAG: alkaline phosphatase family protein [Actinomycetota bacterium]